MNGENFWRLQTRISSKAEGKEEFLRRAIAGSFLDRLTYWEDCIVIQAYSFR